MNQNSKQNRNLQLFKMELINFKQIIYIHKIYVYNLSIVNDFSFIYFFPTIEYPQMKLKCNIIMF